MALTVQPRGEPMRFFRRVVEVERLPAVGDEVAVARYPGTSASSSPITAKVTALIWRDLTFTSASLFLLTDVAAVSLASLTDASEWVDEEA